MKTFVIKHFRLTLALSGWWLLATNAYSQLSSNPDKFLGNITTDYQVDYGNEPFYTLWNQITPENESKWGSVEGTKGSYNWGCDKPFNYAKQHNFTYKFHALVWGSQYPNWLPNLSAKDRYAAMVKWYDAVKKKYATLPLIDVVNEAVGTHQAGNPMMKESLGGGGKTGYDWLIKAFEMAYERWPESILIYNDFNTFQWDTDNYITLVQTLRDAGAPIDAYGCQSHDLTDCDINTFKNSMTKIQNALKMPMYITEYDIGTGDNAYQKQRYQEQIPYMWEADYCAGVTLWGYIYGHTWTTDGNSGIIKDGQDRPAMTWLRSYMQSDAAKTAKSPFPGMKKEASVYVRPAALKVARGDVLPILVRAKMATKTIEKVELYVGTQLIATMTEAPYLAEYAVPTNTTGWKQLKAVVTTTDGTTYERLSRFNVLTSTTKREPYSTTIPELPGTINILEYDKGAAGVSYNNVTRSTAVTKDGAWMEYTVDVTQDGIYSFDAEVAAAKAGGMFHLAEYKLDNLDYLSEFVEVPSTGGINKYQTMHGVLQMPLTAGRHVICLNIDKGGFYIKSLTFQRYEENKSISVNVYSLKPATILAGDTTTITVTAKATNSAIGHVSVYANNLLIGTLTEAPYTVSFSPTEKGSYAITAIATDTTGQSKTSSARTLKVNAKRTPYRTVIAVPGIIEAENFDKGGEGATFHDSDSNDEGDANYRTDNEGLDLVKGNNGTAIGYTVKGEWTEYSVNVKEPGEYSFTATCSNGSSSNGGFSINLVKSGVVTTLASVPVAPTGGWNTYAATTGKLTKHLAVGEQILRFTITNANCNIDKVKLECTLNTGINEIPVERNTDNSNNIYNLSGQKVDANYQGIIIRNGRKMLNRRR